MPSRPPSSFQNRLERARSPRKSLPLPDIEQRILRFQKKITQHCQLTGRTKQGLYRSQVFDLSLFDEEPTEDYGTEERRPAA